MQMNDKVSKTKAKGVKAFFDSLKMKLVPKENLTGSAATILPKDGTTPIVDRFTEILSPVYFDDGLLLAFLNDGGSTPVASVARTYEINPAVWVDDSMAKSLERLLTLAFPKDTVFAVTLYAGHDVRSLLTDMIASRSAKTLLDADAQGLLMTMAASRAQMLDARARSLSGRTEGESEGEGAGSRADTLPVRDFRVWVSVVTRVGQASVIDFLQKTEGKGAEVLKTARDALSGNAVAEFLSAASGLEATLTQYGLLKHVWDKDTLTQTMRAILNPAEVLTGDEAASVALHSVNAYEKVRDGFVYADTLIDVDKTKLTTTSIVNNKRIEAVSLGVTGYPRQFHVNRMAEVLGSALGEASVMPGNFLLTTVIEPTDPAQDKARVGMKHARMRQLGLTELGHYLTDLGERAADLEVAMKSLADGKGLARVTQTLLIFAREGEAQRIAQTARNVLSRVGLDAHVDAGLQMMGLLLSLPMEAGSALMKDVRAARRTVTMTSEAAASLLPVSADFKGSAARIGEIGRTPQLLLTSRRGQLFGVDIFANRNGNFNAVVAGTSGSGKSVLAQELVMSMLATGGRVWVFDIGKSYQKCVELAHGQFIDFDTQSVNQGDKPLCMNPLDMLDDAGELLDEIAEIVTVMANGNAPMERTESELLKQTIASVVSETRARGAVPTITDLTMALMGKSDPGLRDLAVRLMPYAAGGRFARFFEGAANVDFKSPLVVLEMEALSNKPVLQSAALLILMMRILNEIKTTPRSLKKMIVIDEAWRLLTGNAGEFIEWACRTLRKYGAGIVCISQSMEDFQTSSAARAVRMNADTVFLLRQKAQGIAAYTHDAGLQRLLGGLTTVSEVYSEVYVRVGDAPGVVGRLMLDSFSMTAYSTRSDVFEAVNAAKSCGMSTVEAIGYVADREVKRMRGKAR